MNSFNTNILGLSFVLHTNSPPKAKVPLLCNNLSIAIKTWKNNHKNLYYAAPEFLASTLKCFSTETFVSGILKRGLNKFSPSILTFKTAFVVNFSVLKPWEFESEILFIVTSSATSKGVF